MFNAKNPNLFSRRKVLKQTVMASAGLGMIAVAGKNVLADGFSSKMDTQLAEISKSQVTPTTTYKMYHGLDFKPLVSSTGYSTQNYFGIYANSNPYFFGCTIDLPDKARITEIQFYSYHNVDGEGVFRLSYGIPGSPGQIDISTATISSKGSYAIQIVQLPNLGNLEKIDNSLGKYILLWLPSDVSNQEILYGARVGYTGGVARFAA